MQSPVLVTDHRDDDDLLTAGLGLAGLRSALPPDFADAAHPSYAERRRRTIWASWRGIADLSGSGPHGSGEDSMSNVPGREFATLRYAPGATQPHRVLLQLPDIFDTGKRCVVVTVASGSRGIYGGIAVGAAWGLPRGCAVVHTDKGCGSDYFDLDANEGVALDGARVAAEEAVAFHPEIAADSSGVAFRHAHSGDNPEADWGTHVRQAAEFALRMLDEALPAQAPFTFENTRIIATGISNGGGAVLRAAEMGAGWLDGVVAGAPNVWVEGAPPLYDYATQAALLTPAALLALPAESLPQPPMQAQCEAAWKARCASLRDVGLVEGESSAAQAASALRQLRASGWTEAAIRGGAASVGFDLWRSIAAAYASAYGRFSVDSHPCGMHYAALDSQGLPRAATAQERAAWWSDGSGIPPGNAIALIDPCWTTDVSDPAFPGLQRLRALWTEQDANGCRVQQGIRETKTRPPAHDIPTLVVHGEADGLIPAAFSSTPYIEAARAAGCEVAYWRVEHAQHFDAFLAFPDYRARYVALLPHVHAGLDRMWQRIVDRQPLGADRVM